MDRFNAKAVLRQTGLTAELLRAWERRYGAVRPTRSPTGRRLYTTQEIQRLRMLAELVRRGVAIGQVAREPDQALSTLLAQTEKTGTQEMAEQEKREADVVGFIQALRKYDLQRLRQHLARVRFSQSPRHFTVDFIPTIMFHVGAGVSDGTLSIAQEHAMSDLIMRELREIYRSLEVIDGVAQPTVQMIFATREGDFHEFGLLMSAVIARYRGIRCQYLGVNLPADSLNQAIQSLKPNAVVLGLAYLPPEEEKVTAQSYLKAVTQARKQGIEIWAGGSAVSQVKRKEVDQDLLLFESLAEFEKKLELRFPSDLR
jgi:DNA-binding transcriptional MerR regulator